MRKTMYILFALTIVLQRYSLLHAAGDHIYGSFFNVQYLRNYAGDTITVDIPDVPAVIGKKMMIRIRGIDTPELRGKCKKETILARRAKRLVRAELRNAKRIDLLRVGRGKYFRFIADVKYDSKDLGSVLLKNNLAVPYNGGKKKKDWCSSSLADLLTWKKE